MCDRCVEKRVRLSSACKCQVDEPANTYYQCDANSACVPEGTSEKSACVREVKTNRKSHTNHVDCLAGCSDMVDNAYEIKGFLDCESPPETELNTTPRDYFRCRNACLDRYPGAPGFKKVDLDNDRDLRCHEDLISSFKCDKVGCPLVADTIAPSTSSAGILKGLVSGLASHLEERQPEVPQVDPIVQLPVHRQPQERVQEQVQQVQEQVQQVEQQLQSQREAQSGAVSYGHTFALALVAFADL